MENSKVLELIEQTKLKYAGLIADVDENKNMFYRVAIWLPNEHSYLNYAEKNTFNDELVEELVEASHKSHWGDIILNIMEYYPDSDTTTLFDVILTIPQEPLSAHPDSPMCYVQIPVTYEHLVTLFSDGFNGSDYWAEVEWKFPKNKKIQGNCAEEKIVDLLMSYSGSSIVIYDVSDDEPVTHIITDRDVKRALQTMYDKYPQHFANLISEHDDADTGDVFFQLLCFDEAIYG